MSGEWRCAAASVRGGAHRQRGQPCQDAHGFALARRADGREVLVACVSDGAGSAARSAEGAARACQSFLHAASDWYAPGESVSGQDPLWLERAWRVFARRWLRQLRRDLRRVATAEGLRPRDYAATFLGVVIEPERAGFLQVGDGVVVTSDRDEPNAYIQVFWPDRGEYANETHFITEERVSRVLATTVARRPVLEAALLTDGLQNLALQFDRRKVHEPFFRGAFRPLRAEPAGPSDHLAAALAAFLDSPLIRARTDDDLTLVLASRSPG